MAVQKSPDYQEVAVQKSPDYQEVAVQKSPDYQEVAVQTAVAVNSVGKPADSQFSYKLRINFV